MNPFDSAIAKYQRQAAEQQEAQAAQEAERLAERQRQAAIVTESLTGLILPLLEQAAESLRRADICSEVGNGYDPTGQYPRRSLRLILPHQTYPPALIFEAEVTNPTPCLSWHIERNEPRAKAFLSTNRLTSPTRETIEPIITDFLAVIVSQP